MSGEGSSSHTVIPGPMGLLQTARRIRSERSEANQVGQSTQEVMVALADPANDPVFNSMAWLSAMKFVSEGGVEEFLSQAATNPEARDCATFKDIKKLRSHTAHRVAQVVGAVESITKNDDGKSLLVVLKDPTGTMRASIFKDIFVDKETAPTIAVGSVLVVANVAVWAHTIDNFCLNIVKRNLVRVYN